MDDMRRGGAMNAAPLGFNALGPSAPVIEPLDDVIEEVPVLVSKVHLPKLGFTVVKAALPPKSQVPGSIPFLM